MRKIFKLRDDVHIDRLLAFFTFRNLELYILTLFQAAETVFVDAGVVNKDVGSHFGCDEAITFG